MTTNNHAMEQEEEGESPSATVWSGGSMQRREQLPNYLATLVLTLLYVLNLVLFMI